MGRLLVHLKWHFEYKYLFFVNLILSCWKFEEDLDCPLLIEDFERAQVLKNNGFIRRKELDLLKFPYPASSAMISSQTQVVYKADIPIGLDSNPDVFPGENEIDQEGKHLLIN